MMNRDYEMGQVKALITWWLTQIKMENYETYYDINKISEHLCRQLLNLIYNFQLEDLNKTIKNYPGLDIGDDKKALIAYQVTSRTDRTKIIDNLQKVVDKGSQKTFSNGIRFLILSTSGKIEFSKRSRQPDSILPSFKKETDIVYPHKLIQDIEEIYEKELMKFYQIKALLSKEINLPTTPSAPTEQLAQINDLLQQLVNKTDKQESQKLTISNAFFYADLKVPDFKIVSSREELVNELWQEVEKNELVWLQGAPSIGKTTVAALLSKKASGSVLWLECRDVSHEQIIEHILSLLTNHLGIGISSTYEKTLQGIQERLPAESLLIINDLPELQKSKATQDHFAVLIARLSAIGHFFIVTSNHSQPATSLQSFGVDVVSKQLPGFTKNDTETVLEHFGADDSEASLLSELITQTTEGHPLLVQAAGKFLQQKEWSIDDETIKAIFSGRYGDDVEKESYSRVLENTSDEETRNLLYRLRYVIGDIAMDTINIIASVSPAIALPAEKVNHVKGIWLQDTADNKFQLSPLIRTLGGNIAKDVEREIYKSLGLEIIQKENISQIEAWRAAFYFISAGDNNQAAMVLQRVAAEFAKQPEIFFDWGFDSLWYYQSIPKDVLPLFKVQIRVLQINITREAGKDIAFLLDDLKQIIAGEEIGLLGRTLVDLLFFSLNCQAEPLDALQHLINASDSYEKIGELAPKEIWEPNAELFNGIWIIFAGLSREHEYEQWFEAYKHAKLPKSTKDPHTNSSYAMAGVSIQRNAVAKNEIDKAPYILERIINHSEKEDLLLLTVYGLKFLAAYYIREKDDFAMAEALKTKYAHIVESDPVYLFLFYEEMGRRYFHAGNLKAAHEYLSRIASVKMPPFYTEQLDYLVNYSLVLYKTDPLSSPYYIYKALSITLQEDYYLFEDKIKLYGEAAIASSNQKNLTEALNFYSKGYRQLMEKFNDSDEHKAIVIRYGNALKYLTELLEQPQTSDFGDGKNVIPEPGFFYRSNEKLLEGGFFFDERRFINAHFLQNAFEVIGDYESAKYWAYKSIEYSLDLDDPKYSPILQTALFYLIDDGHYGQAYDVLAHIENFYTKQKQKLESGELTDPVLIKTLTTVKLNDTPLYYFVLLPIAFSFSLQIIEEKINPGEYSEFINKSFRHGRYLIKDEASFLFAKQIFEKISLEKISLEQFYEQMIDYTGEHKQILYYIGYILLGSFVNASQAADLQFQALIELEAVMSPMKGYYRFFITEYFEKFWKRKFDKNPDEFSGRQHLAEKGFPLIAQKSWEKKLSTLFRVLSNHLVFDLSNKMENFIDRN